jgi:hypothetical protein
MWDFLLLKMLLRYRGEVSCIHGCTGLAKDSERHGQEGWKIYEELRKSSRILSVVLKFVGVVTP